jgi:enterochelin esterase-like enzyme
VADEADADCPILYLIPGRSSGPDSWFSEGLADIVDRIILSHEIPPFIILTTENIDNDPLAETIYNDLIPYIENKYPVLNGRQYHTAAGGSLGDIAAYHIAFQHLDVFSSASIFGARATLGEESRINVWLSSMNKENRIRVFMDTGDEDPLMLNQAEVLKSMLDTMRIENTLHTGHSGHNYAYWGSNFEVYIKWLASDSRVISCGLSG